MRVAFLYILSTFGSLVFGQTKEINDYKKGDFRLDLKLPWLNHLSLNPERQFKESRFGFVGEGLGIEYNYTKNKYLETSASFAATSEIPFPVHIDKEYNKSLWTFYVTLTDNTIKKRFTIGYGINYSINTWAEWTRDFDTIGLPTNYSKTLTNKNWGITLNSFFRVGKSFNIGLFYQPSLLNLDNKLDFIYEHLISLEVNWRIKLFNANKKSE